MSRIRGRNTGPEVSMRRHLRAVGLGRRYRIDRRVAGTRPDVSFPASRVAVFVDGCFWHRCPQCRRRLPASNRGYWVTKLRGNVARDRRADRCLRLAGWRVLRFWEHAVLADPRGCALAVARAVQDRAPRVQRYRLH